MKSFLIVDDSETIRKTARKMLESMAYSCNEAENGQQALEFCQQTMPDGILLDWNMPVMTGIEFVEKLRALTNGKKPVVIFCSSKGEKEDIRQALDSGANEYIIKPFDSDILFSKLQLTGLAA